MNNKIQKPEEIEKITWGEDLHLVWQQSGGRGPLAKESGERLFSRYVIAIRKELETNETVREIATTSTPAISGRDMMLEALSYLINPASAEIFEKAVCFILEELDRLRTNPASLYVVDVSTGLTVIPIGDGDIYQPPDLVDDFGRLRKATPIIHPRMSSGLALAAASAHKMNAIAELSQSDPLAKMAYEHLIDQDSVARSATEMLLKSGIQDCSEGEMVEIEFGHESIASGPTQSQNFSFHRRELLSRILVKRIIALLDGIGSATILEAKKIDGSKKQWWKAKIRLKQAHVLNS
ncbi:MAG TPA: hypothetical protein VIE65_02130 [Methylobacter sp.]|jgi:hypothetical protein